MIESLIEQSRVLVEAFSNVRRLRGKSIVVKYGGSTIDEEKVRDCFGKDIVLLKWAGLTPIVVHGGGLQIDRVLSKMGKKSQFVKGMRVTDKETMEVVEMVLAGRVNKEIVSLINRQGGKAIGLSGKDGGLIKAKKLELMKHHGEVEDSHTIDIGMVGEVKEISPGVIKSLKDEDFIPVIAPVAEGEDGETFNMNADLVAGKLASALKAEILILLTNVEGVFDENHQPLLSLNVKSAKQLIAKKVISSGMIPKVTCCLEALNEGVVETHIIDGRVRHAILLDVLANMRIGTRIIKK